MHYISKNINSFLIKNMGGVDNFKGNVNLV